MTEARRLVIHGRVQGVGYRDWMVGRAQALGAKGWVRNCADGTVEAVVVGAADVIEAMIAQAHKGPGFARVDRVDVEPVEPPAESDFRRLPTA